ncbi:hypothetical protein ACH4D5_15310 [Streptomyces sp. NPDC018029]|uniref:hypothetical protein n=1 Tax=Streptomyces sp. NPDC018029 TaxID=3365032 RepID=UPI00378DDC76
MKTHHVTRFLSVGLLIAVLAAAAVHGWPIWVWFLLPAICAGALLIDMRVPRSERESRASASAPDEVVPERPAESPYRETSVVSVPVESSVADCPFLFSATVWWRPAVHNDPLSHGNPGALASASVLERVQRLTSTEHPNQCMFLEHSMESELGQPVLEAGGLVITFATDIRLTLRAKDREHLDELEGLRKAVGTWESRQQHERNVREYLGGDVLQSPGSAVVWWMARHDDQIERAVEMIGPLTVLSATANDEEIPEDYRAMTQPHAGSPGGGPMDGLAHPEPTGEETGEVGPSHRSAADYQSSMDDPLTSLLASIGIDEGSVEGAVFLRRLMEMSEAAGRPEAAENIRRRMHAVRQEEAPSRGYGEPGDHDPEEAGPPPRAADWQVAPDGAVSEADETDWWDRTASGPDGLDPTPERGGR